MKQMFEQFSWVKILLVLGVYALVYVLIEIDVINAYYQITLVKVGITLIGALGLNMILGISGQFSLGHAGFMAIGAYSVAIVTLAYPSLFGWVVGLLIGIVITTIVGLFIAIPTLRLRGDYLAIATLGTGEIIRIVLLNLKITNGAAGLSSIPKFTDWTLLYVFIVIALLFMAHIKYSRFGRAALSVKDDEIAAEAMGIQVTKIKVMIFIFGAIFASIAGALYASFFYVIKPEAFGISKSIEFLMVVVLGGMGSISGTIAAAVVMELLTTLLQTLAQVRMIVYALVLIVLMIYRPQGLLGTKEISINKLFRRKVKADGNTTN
ncbi:MAG: branched-chain amino acid ABC transporter permease [Erysipelothrix sp.]|jgi:branched-chain amino acid transport system permease protein|nr:branched-chain amino acid ABC transporter permease [Erysipelothrix sp.]